MQKNGDVLRVRIDPQLRIEAEKVLSNLELGHSDAIRMLYRQIVLKNGLPFSVDLNDSKSETKR